MKVTIEEICTGCGVCVDVCGEVFDLGEDGLANVLVDPVPEDHQAACREAAEACPVQAVIIQE